MDSKTTPAHGDVNPHVWHHIKQAGSAGLGFQQLLAQTGLAFDTVIGAVVSHYIHGDIRCFLETGDLRCVAQYVPDCTMASGSSALPSTGTRAPGRAGSSRA